MKIKSIRSSMSGTILWLEVDGKEVEVKTYYDNSGLDKFEVEGKVFTYLGGFRYE